MLSRSLVAGGVLILSAFAGCGGGGDSGGGPSIAEEYRQALEASNPETSVRELVRVAYKYNTARDASGAERAASDAANKAAKVTDPAARAAAFNSVAGIQGTLKLKSATKQSLVEVERASQKIPAPETRATALAYMAATYGRHLEEKEQAKYYFDEAEKLAGTIEAPAAKAKALLAIASHANRVGTDDSKAITERLIAAAGQTAEGLTEPREKTEAYADLGSQLDKMKLKEDAKSAYDKAVAAAQAITQPANKCHALVYIAERMGAEPSRVAAAEALLEKAEADLQAVDPGLRKEVELAIINAKRKLSG